MEKAKKLRACEAKKSEYGDSSKYVTFVSTDKKGTKTTGKSKVEINEKAIENAKKLAGYNMLITSEIRMTASEIYAAYHNLWRIEESFRIMKSQLDARPVFMQKQETITGHFLICYLAVLLTRLLQIHTLKDEYGTEAVSYTHLDTQNQSALQEPEGHLQDRPRSPKMNHSLHMPEALLKAPSLPPLLYSCLLYTSRCV